MNYPKVKVTGALGYDDFEGWLLLDSAEDWPVSVIGFEQNGRRDAVVIPKACITLLEEKPRTTVKVSEDILYKAMSELYNSGSFEMVAEDGTRVFLVGKDPECDECGAEIPKADEGGMANRHHEKSCSLYDPTQD
jgi:hypothetical protein